MKTRIMRIGLTLLTLIGMIGFCPCVVRGDANGTGNFVLEAIPSTVSPGSSFLIIVRVNADVPIWSAQCTLNFDAEKLQCEQVIEGEYLKGWAALHSPASTMLLPQDPVPIDNTAGKVPPLSTQGWETQLGIALMQSVEVGIGPTGLGDLLVFKMKAREGASGTASISLSNITISTERYDQEANQLLPYDLNGVTVLNNNLQVNLSQNSTPAPTITSFTPSSAGPGNTVVITGTNFTGISGTGAVRLGGVDAASYTVDSATQITATIGNGNSGKVSVANAGGRSESTDSFTFTAAIANPVIDSFSPASAAQGATLTITGSHLANASSVKLGNTPATINSNTDTQITVTVGGGTSGTVSVSTPGGISSKSGFTFLLPAPTITSFSPTTGALGTSVTITGTNLSNASAVSFGGTSASISSNSDTQIVAVINRGSHDGNVSIVTPGGTASLSGFTYIPSLPSISSFSPDSAGEGDSITINGANFTGVSAVKFGGTTVSSIESASDSQLVVILGNGSSGDVTITTPEGTGSKSGFTFSANEPTITSFSPTSAGQGTEVTITGTNLGSASEVKFGNTAATIKTKSATQVVAVVGNGSSGDVSVTTPNGSATKSGFTFTASTTTTATTSTTVTTSSTPTSTTTTKTTPTRIVTSRTTTQPNAIQTIKTTPKTQTERKNTTASYPGTHTFDLSDLMNTEGVLQDDFQKQEMSLGGNTRVSLIINKGTRSLNSDGSPLDTIEFHPSSTPPSAPRGKNLIGTLEFEPSGATFSKPITMIYYYDSEQLNKEVDPDSLYLGYFNIEESKWVKCDSKVDTRNHTITARISHFSLYAIMANGNSGEIGSSWSLAGVIIGSELLLGILIVYYFLRRKHGVPLPSSATPAINRDSPAAGFENTSIALEKPNEPNPVKVKTAIWDDILQQGYKNNNGVFKTHLEITGGKIIIPRDGKTADIELINTPESRLLISLEYDPELHPQGRAKIIVLSPLTEYEKSKEFKK